MEKIKFILFVFIMLLSACKTVKPTELTSTAEEYQNNLKNEYLDPESSPLSVEELENFEGLSFFPINNKFVVKAQFVKNEEDEYIEFATSTERKAKYKDIGTLHFVIDAQTFSLHLFQASPVHPDYPDDLFLPFKDWTNGDSSYGGGRYIDLNLKDINNNEIILDFNKSYNPYCAYSPNYSCPIPPEENNLNIEIPAGVSYTPHY